MTTYRNKSLPPAKPAAPIGPRVGRAGPPTPLEPLPAFAVVTYQCDRFGRTVQIVSHAAVDPIVGTPDTEQAAAPSGAPAVTPDDGDTMTPKDRRANHDITRERGCRRMILENWSTIESLCGPAANGRSVLRVLKRELLTDQPLPELKTVQNRLNDLRKEKFIP